MQLICPKCSNPMAQYERNRVLVDQCIECKGIFLDRGELENLVAAERAHMDAEEGRPGPPPLPTHGESGWGREQRERHEHDPRERDRGEQEPYRYGEHRYDERYYGRDNDKKRKRKSILENLLDF
ncbi:MAG: transcriptional regulator [Blastococcus sp.]|jgi:Zn-finger nucleic acid-binding protein|nr:transcriptional regulator [Blastococcus sp.]